jgi:hypothetical protein
MEKQLKIKIDGLEYSIKKSWRSLKMFETLSGKLLAEMNESVTDLLLLLFCLLKANNKHFNFENVDDFIDYLDEHDGENIIELFSDYLNSFTEKNEPQETKKK